MFRQANKSVYWLPLFLIIVVGFDIPILFLVGWSLSNPFPTFQHYVTLGSAPTYARIYANTFQLAAIVTACCVILGYPLSYWMNKLERRQQSAALLVVFLSFWISVLVRSYAWIVILGNGGIVNRTLQSFGLTDAPITFLYSMLGVTIGMVNILLPYLVLPLFAAMRRIDENLIDAAKSLGASDGFAFTRVFLPLSAPALAATAMLVFILSLGFFVTPAILGGGRVVMISNMLNLLINELPRWELAAAASVVLLAMTLIVYWASRRINREIA